MYFVHINDVLCTYKYMLGVLFTEVSYFEAEKIGLLKKSALSQNSLQFSTIPSTKKGYVRWLITRTIISLNMRIVHY